MSEPTTRILKANTARDLPQRVAFNFEDLRQQASAQLLQARQEAAAMVEQARREADALRAKAVEEGRAQGKKEGLQDAQKQIAQQSKQLAEAQFAEQVKSTLPALTQAAAALREERDRWLLRWERSAVELGVAIAEKLLRSSLNARPELSTAMISEVLQLAAGQTHLKVRLHPNDLQQLGTHAEEIVRSLTACATAELIPDAAIAVGGCCIETRHGEIDARIETMLERIAQELLAT